MTNPAQAIRMLITYAICIPLAALVGWLLCNPLDFSTLGFFGFVALILASPFFIRYHYPFLFFGLTCPMTCFFLIGRPPLAEVVAILSLGIAIIERTVNSDKRFISVPVMTWPVLFTLAMVLFTAEMTGGIGLHSVGGDTGGGKKYISLFTGMATYFALISQRIAPNRRWFYIGLTFFPAILGAISDLFPYLPSPFNYINLLFPPSGQATMDNPSGINRMGAFGSAAGVFGIYLVARYGLRGILQADKPWRLPVFLLSVTLSMLGGFRSAVIANMFIFTVLFFLEGLHRTRLLLVVILGLTISSAVTFTFSDKMPSMFQRALSFVPGLKIDPMVLAEAESSKEWRENMWRDLWPKVPQYLLLGKGYLLTREDYEYMNGGAFVGLNSLDQSQTGLAISGDYHSGSLSTLIPFGIWGAISWFWVSFAGLYVLYRNYRYGPEELKNYNRFLLAFTLNGIFGFLFIVGAYSDFVGSVAKLVGISVALNWGVCKPIVVAATTTPRIKPLPQPQPRPRSRPLPA